jgi:hypothetical protein
MTAEPARFDRALDDLLAAQERLARLREHRAPTPFTGYRTPDPYPGARNAVERELERRIRDATLRAAGALK